MLPMFGIKATMKLALIPFVNISLLFNSSLSSIVDPSFVLIAFLSTIVYSILLIMIISKLYNQEDVLFNSRALSYIQFKNGKSKTICFSPLTSLLIALIVLVLSYYFSFMFISLSQYFLLAIMPLTILLVVLVAGLLVRLDFKESFKINGFKLNRLLTYIMIYVCTYIIGNYTLELLTKLFPNMSQNYEIYASALSFDNLGLSILVIAFLPAVFEELLFRGVIFNSFNKRYNFTVGIIVSALLFGVYHMNWIQGVYAFIFGLALAYMYYRSNSIFVPITFHFINNLLATLISYFEINIFIPAGFNYFFIIGGIILLFLAIFVCEQKE
jgi:sodium transport system permease protein